MTKVESQKITKCFRQKITKTIQKEASVENILLGMYGLLPDLTEEIYQTQESSSLKTKMEKFYVIS